jgi:hypothetical protein
MRCKGVRSSTHPLTLTKAYLLKASLHYRDLLALPSGQAGSPAGYGGQGGQGGGQNVDCLFHDD